LFINTDTIRNDFARATDEPANHNQHQLLHNRKKTPLPQIKRVQQGAFFKHVKRITGRGKYPKAGGKAQGEFGASQAAGGGAEGCLGKRHARKESLRACGRWAEEC